MKGYHPPTSDGTSHHTFTHLILVYKLTKLYDVTQVTSRQIESLDEILLPPLVTSVTTRVSSVFTTLPERSNVIVGAPNLGSPPPFRGPQFVLELSQDSQESWPWILPSRTTPASPTTEMHNERILRNERKGDNQDLNPRPYSHAVLHFITP